MVVVVVVNISPGETHFSAPPPGNYCTVPKPKLRDGKTAFR